VYRTFLGGRKVMGSLQMHCRVLAFARTKVGGVVDELNTRVCAQHFLYRREISIELKHFLNAYSEFLNFRFIPSVSIILHVLFWFVVIT
jgi:hypothetical protein